MAENVTTPELRDCRLLTVHFEINRTVVPDPEARLETNLAMTHNYLEDEEGQSCLRLVIKVRVRGEGAPLQVEVEMGGLFLVGSKPADAAVASRLAEIDCAALIFPYLRETIADLTRRAGLAPLHLPTINFVDFYQQKHPGE
jgi:preprotein translocase subunit SecB